MQSDKIRVFAQITVKNQLVEHYIKIYFCKEVGTMESNCSLKSLCEANKNGQSHFHAGLLLKARGRLPEGDIYCK